MDDILRLALLLFFFGVALLVRHLVLKRNNRMRESENPEMHDSFLKMHAKETDF